MNDRSDLYSDIEVEYLELLRSQGIQFAEPYDQAQRDRRIKKLQKLGARVRNKGASIVVNGLSDACVACTGGQGSQTFFLSLQCTRNCYFCFNPNQEDYEQHLDRINDLESEVIDLARQGRDMTHIALTGGEPLLHPQETLRFFATVRSHYPDAHTRLYTAGDLLSKDLLGALSSAGLTEIRFSIKLDDPPELQEQIMSTICMAKAYVPQVMVEMPVIPGGDEFMRSLLLELDEMGIFGINLLEFCFPKHNWPEFSKRGFRVKNPPFAVLYDYRYAGALPIDGSEAAAFDLLEFALEQGLVLGVHYCSLENKHRDEIHQANIGFADSFTSYELDTGDFFLKSIVVFGKDVATVRHACKTKGIPYEEDIADDSLQFHPRYLFKLRPTKARFYVSYNVIQRDGAETALRELKLERL